MRVYYFMRLKWEQVRLSPHTTGNWRLEQVSGGLPRTAQGGLYGLASCLPAARAAFYAICRVSGVRQVQIT